MSIATPARFKKLNDSLREIENEVVETQEHYISSSPQQHLCSKSKRKSQWHQFRISQSEHIDLVLPPSPSSSPPSTPTCSTSGLDPNPQVYVFVPFFHTLISISQSSFLRSHSYHIPLESSKSKVDLFNIDFPVSLRGYLSASFYVEVFYLSTYYSTLIMHIYTFKILTLLAGYLNAKSL